MTKIYHINDRTMKYKSLILNKYQHRYLRLPGTFEARYPQEIVFPNMKTGRADELYSTKEGLMVSLEEESEDIGDKTLEKISNYVIFAEFMYSKRAYSGIICHKNPGKKIDYYERSPSIIIKVHYIYIPQKELWKKYENLIKKIEQKEELDEDETLDIAFIPKFISKEKGQFVTESLARVFKYAIITEKIPKINIGVLLGAMILKHFKNDEKINELMEEIGMKQIDDEIRIIAKEEFREDYEKIEKEKQKLEIENFNVKKEYDKVKKENKEVKKENKEVKKENNKLKEGIEQLKEISDLNSQEAKKIISTLSLL